MMVTFSLATFLASVMFYHNFFLLTFWWAANSFYIKKNFENLYSKLIWSKDLLKDYQLKLKHSDFL